MSIDKTVSITGTGNRYLIKKLLKETPVVKNRKEQGIPDDYYTHEKQMDILETLLSSESEDIYNKLIKNQIDKKIYGYRAQDMDKKKYDEAKFISYEEIINKLYLCELSCYYCKEKMCFLYKIVREHKQWTLDRINNDLGHNSDNVVMSCLECNLRRRKTNSDAFLFTKQLNIIKHEQL